MSQEDTLDDGTDTDQIISTDPGRGGLTEQDDAAGTGAARTQRKPCSQTARVWTAAQLQFAATTEMACSYCLSSAGGRPLPC
jgi:hypothetical protein